MTRKRAAGGSARPDPDRAFRALVDALPDAMIVIAGNDVKYANAAMHELLNEPSNHTLEGLQLADLVDRAGDPLTAIKALASGAVQSDRLEITWRRADRVPVVTECAVSRAVWEEQPAVQIVARDITQRAETDDVIRRAGAGMAVQLGVGIDKLVESNRRLGSETVLRERAEIDRDATLVRLALAGEEERKRLSRELHDEVGQRLTALLLGLRRIIDVAGVGSEVDERAKELHLLAQRLGADLHGVAVRLRPKALDDFGVEAALASYTKEWTRQSGIGAELHAAGHRARLHERVEVALYRIAQEALTNVARHSGATRVSVLLHQAGDGCRLTIEDDGAGFDVAAVRSRGSAARGLGLLGMSERARLVGGTIEIESAPGRGTSVFVSVPCVFADAPPGHAVPR